MISIEHAQTSLLPTPWPHVGADAWKITISRFVDCGSILAVEPEKILVKFPGYLQEFYNPTGQLFETESEALAAGIDQLEQVIASDRASIEAMTEDIQSMRQRIAAP